MARSKECFKCKTVKPLEDFYKHESMADGHLNKCKECTKNDANEHRLRNLEKIREYDRERAKRPERIKRNLEVNKRWRQEDKRRGKAHHAVAYALKKGTLIPLPCEWCGDEKSLAHHEDYDKPLEVVWLCQPCHKKRHKQIDMETEK
jgi:hypothetical protein